MNYIPKNKILPNLYTNGGEFIIEETQENYKGYYYKLYNGELYTGKNPNDKPNIKLINITPSPPPLNSSFNNTKKINIPEGGLIPNTETYSESTLLDYLSLKEIKRQNIKTQHLPSPYYPQPTEADYKLGEFQRYFCVKTNELKYTEVTKEQYEKFKNKDQSVAWQYYIAFTLPWSITGDKEEVSKTNRNIVLITEQNIKRRGLQEFLRNNYLKFCKETPTESSTSNTPSQSSPRGSASY